MFSERFVFKNKIMYFIKNLKEKKAYQVKESKVVIINHISILFFFIFIFFMISCLDYLKINNKDWEKWIIFISSFSLFTFLINLLYKNIIYKYLTENFITFELEEYKKLKNPVFTKSDLIYRFSPLILSTFTAGIINRIYLNLPDPSYILFLYNFIANSVIAFHFYYIFYKIRNPIKQ